MKKPILLCILDGWGERTERDHNAIAQANTPHWDALCATYPHASLHASAQDVGLPAGQMGNSEVGHMNIGAGRIVMQDLPRIDAAIADGALARNAALTTYLDALRRTGGTCHLMGLLSDGGVHAHLSHMAALANLAAAAGIPVAVHAFLDGRDTAPRSALAYLQQFEAATRAHPSIRLATVSGRYYAMDRDTRWERVRLAYDAVLGDGADTPRANSAATAVEAAYAQGLNDEFILPTVMDDYHGMQEGDGLLMANFRADRVRQWLAAWLDPDFTGFARPRTLRFAATLGMVEYSDTLAPFIPALFPPQTLDNHLGAWVAAHGLTQLRIAETEKYAHVTFFFNGGREEPYAGERRILIPSPKVATYDLQPEMAASEVTDALVAAIESGDYNLLVVNYANTDMVGHSGDLTAAIKAVEAVDACLGRLHAAILKAGGAMLVTADHGNAECLHDPDSGQAHTAHTLNPVPCLIVGAAYQPLAKNLGTGILADIAPTLCAMMHLAPPPEMTGRNLLAHAHA
ncbi:MAG: 2,3-bisphosphoglycerate-independent phosphoglycerate mutase [Alphaproteobacteria bacterium]|nr:2,3-bisphosphoglycerate-independent phosphoglycerate mutase [Alphaproteobacteria bacterium]